MASATTSSLPSVYIIVSKFRLELLHKKSLGTSDDLIYLLNQTKDRPIELRAVPSHIDNPIIINGASLDDDDDDYNGIGGFSRNKSKSNVQYDLEAEDKQQNDIFGFGNAVAQYQNASATMSSDPIRLNEELMRINRDLLGALWTQQYSFTLQDKHTVGDMLVMHCDSILIFKHINKPSNEELENENKHRIMQWIAQLTEDQLLVDKIELLGRTMRSYTTIEELTNSLNTEAHYSPLLQFIRGDFASFMESIGKLGIGEPYAICLNYLIAWHSKFV